MIQYQTNPETEAFLIRQKTNNGTLISAKEDDSSEVLFESYYRSLILKEMVYFHY